MLMYLASGFTYAKIANLILWVNTDPRFGGIFLILFISNFMIRWNFESR